MGGPGLPFPTDLGGSRGPGRLNKNIFVSPLKRCEFIWFGDLPGPKPYESILCGDLPSPQPYEFIWFGDLLGPKPYELIWFETATTKKL